LTPCWQRLLIMADLRSEAALYAVQQRIAPVLRHEVAGLMQPVRMLMTVLERQMKKSDLDLVLISENVTSVSMLTKEASVGCINAISWISPKDDVSVDLRTSIEELKRLLSLELHGCSLSVINGIAEVEIPVARNFVRTVLIGILLAFCDEQTCPASIHLTINEMDAGQLQFKRDFAIQTGDDFDSQSDISFASKKRSIHWTDVEAMADIMGLTVARGVGWVNVNLPSSVTVELDV
jgi:hypothetical protein